MDVPVYVAVIVIDHVAVAEHGNVADHVAVAVYADPTVRRRAPDTWVAHRWHF